MTVTMRLQEDENIVAAAKFVAELVRQGVTFEAREEYAQHPSGLRVEAALIIKLTGGF